MAGSPASRLDQHPFAVGYSSFCAAKALTIPFHLSFLSKYAVLERINVKTAAAVTEALTQRMGPFRDLVHTLTADNGKEFAGHQAVSDAPAADFHFAPPYSWERGLNERTTGLVRQYFPKGQASAW